MVVVRFRSGGWFLVSAIEEHSQKRNAKWQMLSGSNAPMPKAESDANAHVQIVKCTIAKCSNAQLPNAQMPNAQMLQCQMQNAHTQ